jgi:methyl-accepting chemotaxis protein
MSDAAVGLRSATRGRNWFRNSLAWRLVLPIPLALALAIAAIWLIIPRLITANAVSEAVIASRQTAAEFKTIRTYYTENVVNKVLKSGALHASVDHKTDDKAIPLPATMIQDLSNLLAKNDTAISLYSKYPFANRRDRRLDAFQQEAWDYLSANPTATFARQ